MKLYDLNEYLFIIYYTDFTTSIRKVSKDKIEDFIKKLNEYDEVFDYTLVKKVDYEY